MWVFASVPDFGPNGRAVVARLHAREGERLTPGSLLIDFDVDLSGGVVRDCPPVSTCRIVLRESLWLRRLRVRPGDAVQADAAFADLSLTPDALPDEGSRKAKVTAVAVVHHADWWSGAS